MVTKEDPLVPKKILVVEDDKSFSATVESMLALKGFKVTVAGDGVEAKSLLALEPFDLVISDIRLPNLSGIELLHFVKRTKPIPVVLMTGFSEISDTKEAYDLGAAGFLSKPFRKQELFDALEKILFPDGLPEPDLDDQFSGLNLEEFFTGNEIQYDIYVRLTSSKYVRIAAAGEALDLQRIRHYQGKGVTHLYLRKDDLLRYLGFAKHLAKKVADSTTIERSRKAAFFAQQAGLAVKSLYREKVDPQLFETTSELMYTSVSVLCEQSEGALIFEALRNQGDPAYTHSLAVSLYSTLVAKYLGWQSPRSLLRLSMAGLLHDIGKKEIPLETRNKPRVALTPEEIHLVESHPARGYEILNTVPDIPEEALQVVLQHHEDCRGLGYPMRLTKNHIAPLARLVGVVEEFCELCFPDSSTQSPMEPLAAMRRMQEAGASRFDAEYLGALAAVIEGKRRSSSS